MASVRLEFEGSAGRPLVGKLELPDDALTGYALLAPCFTCGKDFTTTKRLARGLAAQGWATLRLDFAGLGESGGAFADTGLGSHVEDLIAAAAVLRAQYAAPSLLIGHSFGGVAAVAAAPHIEGVQAVAVIGTPFEPAHVLHQLDAALPAIERAGEAEVQLAGRPFTFRRSFVDEVRSASLADALATGRRALLVLHAPRDEVVSIENARALYLAARHPKSFVSLDDADHLLTRSADAAYAAGVIAAWARRYAPEPARRPMDAEPVPHGTVLVEETGAGRFHQAIRAGRHRLTADEPEAVGGEDAGPSPYDLLLASLGACTSMTLRMYAERKALPLDAVEVRLTHRKVHAQDCADCETKEGRIDEITREITLTGALTDEQRARLLEIADRCPVHRTLEGEIKVRTSLRRA